MKTLFVLLLLLSNLISHSQEIKTININTLQENSSWYKSQYLNPDFKIGKVIFKDEAFAEARFNFNRLTGQMLFIHPKGDTLALARPETTSAVVIENDTFCFYEKSFLHKISHKNIGANLYVKKIMKYIGTEKKGPYGTYSAVSSTNSSSTFSNDDQVTQYIALDENRIYKVSPEFYLSDNFNNFFPAKKSRFYSLFSEYHRELKSFFDKNKINFNNKEHLLRVIDHLEYLMNIKGR